MHIYPPYFPLFIETQRLIPHLARPNCSHTHHHEKMARDYNFPLTLPISQKRFKKKQSIKKIKPRINTTRGFYTNRLGQNREGAWPGSRTKPTPFAFRSDCPLQGHFMVLVTLRASVSHPPSAAAMEGERPEDRASTQQQQQQQQWRSYDVVMLVPRDLPCL